MTHYDFDKIIPRRGTNSVKWDMAKEEDVIPMWVADMDFEVAPAIKDAVKKRADHGIFGYTKVPDAYFQSIADWFERRHNWKIDTSSILYTTGVVPALTCCIKALTRPNDKVLIQTPVYNMFYPCITNNGREMAESPLIYENNTYRIDWEDFEEKLSDSKVKIFILCNPHNPGGRVWTIEELSRIGRLCLKHGVIVVADEIHCELAMPEFTYTPMATVLPGAADNVVTCNSPSKAFNIAGLQIANVVCPSKAVRNKIDEALKRNNVSGVNPFGVLALQAAYNESGEWLDELNRYLDNNFKVLKDFLNTNFPQVGVTMLEGTYLVWLDMRQFHISSDELTKKLLHEGKVFVNSGTLYGKHTGEGFLRVNIACAHQTMLEGLNRMARVLRTL